MLLAGAVVVVNPSTLFTAEQVGATKAPEQVQRIVSLAPNLTEILFALGLGKRVVAVSNNSDYPPEANSRRKVGTFWQPGVESVISARPDLILALSFPQQNSAAETFRRLKYDVLTLEIETIDGLFEAIYKIGTATESSKKARKLIEDIKQDLNAIQSKCDNCERPRVLWVVQAEPLRVAGRKTFINQIIELAGGKNAVKPGISQYPQIGTEQILTYRPEVIIHSAMSPDLSQQRDSALTYWSRYPDLPAVRNRKIHVLEADTISRLGPRLPQGLEVVARCLQPKAFDEQNGS